METQARRRDLRLAQNGRAPAQDPTPWPTPSELDVHLRPGGLQLGPHPQPGRGHGMTDGTVTERACRFALRRTEWSQQASAALRNTFEAMNLSFSHGFSAAC